MAHLNVVVPEHPPEVTDCVGKRALGGYVGNLVIQTLWGGRERERGKEREGEREGEGERERKRERGREKDQQFRRIYNTHTFVIKIEGITANY